MRTNAMTKCAAGAMLFGGSLGLTQAASAGVVTFLDGPVGTSPSAYAAVSNIQVNNVSPGPVGGSAIETGAATTVTASGSKNSGGTTWTLSVTGTLSTTATGIELLGTRSGNVTDAGAGFSGTRWNNTTYVAFQRVFSVTGGSVNWSGSVAANTQLNGEDNLFAIFLLDPTTGELMRDENWEPVGVGSMNYLGAAAGSFTGTLGVGHYAIVASAYVNQGDTDRSLATFNWTAVPAPGAIALLGAAGLVGARRRR